MECHRKFAQKVNMLKHYKRHTGEHHGEEELHSPCTGQDKLPESQWGLQTCCSVIQYSDVSYFLQHQSYACVPRTK